MKVLFRLRRLTQLNNADPRPSRMLTGNSRIIQSLIPHRLDIPPAAKPLPQRVFTRTLKFIGIRDWYHDTLPVRKDYASHARNGVAELLTRKLVRIKSRSTA